MLGYTSPPRQVWRVVVKDRATRLSADLDRIATANQQGPDYSLAKNSLAEARKAARLDGEKLGWWWILNWFTGAPIEAAWIALHRAQQALVPLLSDAEVRAAALEARATLALSPLDSKDPRGHDYQEQLDRIVAQTGSIGADDRLALRKIEEFFHSRSDTDHGQIRTFRNILLILALALTFGLAIVTVAAWRDPQAFSLCGPLASGQASCLVGGAPRSADILLIELVGGLGGLISAVFFLRGVIVSQAPYALPAALGVLKVPAGAATGLIGVMFLHHGLLAVPSVDGPKLLAFAAIFGFAQQAVTNFADTKGSELLTTAGRKDQSATKGASA